MNALTIENRLTKLERKNRWLTLALLLLGIAAIMAVAMGQGAPTVVPQEVTAHKFILVDTNGNLRASLMVDENGRPGLLLGDENDKLRVSLSVDKDGPCLSLSDEDGKKRASLMLLKHGRPALCLFDENDKLRSSLVLPKGGPDLTMYNENGKVAVSLCVDKELGRGLGVFDENGVGRANLMLFKDGPDLALYDENGRPLRSLPSTGRQPAMERKKVEYQQLPRGSSNIVPDARDMAPPPAVERNVIESRIDGNFEGWNGDTVVRLVNGQIWHQIAPHIEIHIAVNPKVVIYRSGAKYKMQVEGTREPIEVEQLK